MVRHRPDPLVESKLKATVATHQRQGALPALILTRRSRNQIPEEFRHKELMVESIDLQRVRPPMRSELVGSHLRGDRLYGQVVSSRRPTLAVRSEIGPYRRPSQRYLALPKNNQRRHSNEEFLGSGRHSYSVHAEVGFRELLTYFGDRTSARPTADPFDRQGFAVRRFLFLL
jgi:hypothetical protein